MITAPSFRIIGLPLLLVLAAWLGHPADAQAQAEGVRITKAQKAAILFVSGNQRFGTLLSLNAKEVRFQPTGLGDFTYKASQIKAVFLADDLLVYNADKKIFESKKGQAPLPTPASAKETSPAPEPKESSGKKPASKPLFPELDNEKPAAKGPGKTLKVIAEGVGTNPDKALKDAFRNAVRQVVGAVVDAETLVKNDEIIADKVLTYSGGFITTYKEISKKREDDLHRIKIEAVVERTSVVAKLKSSNVKVKDIDGGGLFAEAVTGLEAEKNAQALLKKALENFPQNCMTASVIGKPKLLERNEVNATVQIQIQVEPNFKNYKAFVDHLNPSFA